MLKPHIEHTTDEIFPMTAPLPLFGDPCALFQSRGVRTDPVTGIRLIMLVLPFQWSN